jgi:hypothetical protein
MKRPLFPSLTVRPRHGAPAEGHRAAHCPQEGGHPPHQGPRGLHGGRQADVRTSQNIEAPWTPGWCKLFNYYLFP